MALIVNQYGGPGRGKSTTAYKLIGMLKANNYKAELVVESAKEASYTNSLHKLQDQVYLIAKHNNDLRILENQVDIIVTDGSLLNCLAYCTEDQKIEKALAKELYSRFNNIGFIVPRKENYMKYGRSQTREEAVELDKKIFDSLFFLPVNECIDLQHLEGNDEEVLNTIYKHVIDRVNK
jgi:tRNA uridine 5-carbamoylmethylation protein Kti12